MKVAAIYLAAGQSSRMGRPKLSLELAPGKRLGASALEEVLGCADIGRVIVVVREEDDLDWCREPIAADTRGRMAIVPCPIAREGMSHSIRCGLKRALDDDPDAILVVLADQPFISSSKLTSLIANVRRRSELDYMAFGREGKAHPPVLFRRGMYAALNGLKGDEGARRLLAESARRGELLDMEAFDFFVDVDTSEDWEKAAAITKANASI